VARALVPSSDPRPSPIGPGRRLGSGFGADPFPFYRRWREASPVLEIAHEGEPPELLVTGYEEVRELLRDERVSADRRRAPRLRALLAAAPLRPDLDSMLVRDDPDHERLRRLVSQAFTRRSVSALEPRIRALACAQLDTAARQGRFDAVADYAEPVATLVIAELMGIESQAHERFRGWTQVLLAGLFGSARAKSDVIRARRELDGTWLELICARRAAPRDDLVSDLLEARDAGQQLSDPELLGMLNLILVAGHESSANGIASTLFALLRESEAHERARSADDAWWANAVEETLRWQSPIQTVARAARTGLELAGRRVPAGSALTLLLGAANRDPRVFRAPDRFDPARQNAKQHLAFGFGDHFCLGAALARAEMAIAARTVFERFPRARLAEPRPPWRRTVLLRGLERLPLRI